MYCSLLRSSNSFCKRLSIQNSLSTKMSSQIPTSQRIQHLIDFVSGLSNSSSSSNATNYDEKIDDSEKEKFYITTAINYTNGVPHIGHAYEAITTDIIARYHRIYGRDVFFLTGTDEHGQKVATTAEKAHKTPIKFCDENVAVFKKLNEKLDISNDYFIRTTDPKHLKFCQQLWERSLSNGDIYLSNYEGWYNVREEHFVPEAEAKQNDYKDPTSGTPLTKNKEEAYFFRMSKYQDDLVQHLKSNPTWILPQAKYNDILQRISEPLVDLCVSRSSFDWGVPVPNNEKHVMYVWFDALSNYLSGIDYFDHEASDLHKYWPADVHVIGKDIVWFHCVIWPCILLSCKIPLPKCVMAHGFVLDKNGDKMSKSLKNVIDPFELLSDKYGYKSDSLRYFIAHQAVYGSDMKFNVNEFEFIHDSNLTKTYGNLVNRVLNLCNSYFKKSGGMIPDNIESLSDEFNNEYGFNLVGFRNEIELLMKTFCLSDVTALIHGKFELCNRWLTEQEPWKLKNKKDEKRKLQIMKTILEAIYICTHFQQPFTPDACSKVFEYIGQKPMDISKLSDKLDNLRNGTKISKGQLLFKQFISKHETKQLNASKPDIACVEFVVGKVLSVEQHPNADKCYVEKVDIGEPKPRQIVSGLVPFCKPNELKGSLVVIFKNLKSGKIRQELSEGMLLAANNEDRSMITPIRPPKGSKIGERLLWSEQDITVYKPDGNINIKKKNSVWLNISPKLRTNDKGEVCFDGSTLTTSAGPVMADLKDAQIG